MNGLDEGNKLFATRRFVPSLNYTYTKSKLKVKAGDAVRVFGAASTIATDYFRNGTPLTGQSDHIVNLQLGIEDTDGLSQQTILIGYASKRVVSRGLNGSPPQPDVIERPGLTIDFVARQGFTLLNREIEVKFEARNLTGRKHLEFQKSGGNRVDTNSYKLGRIFSLSASVSL
jgi:outer membrane receptor protein involved in Fe transport